MVIKTDQVKDQLKKLEKMRSRELCAKFEELFGFRAPDSTARKLRFRIAYRLQEIYFGGLSEADKSALEEAAAKDPLARLQAAKNRKRPVLPPGSQLRRVWKGVEHVVNVIGDGVFEYNGEQYTSLTRLAGAITGGKWNGRLFFGLK